MIRINSLTIKNFMSIGNVTQSIDFSKDELVLVLGENLDLGGNDNKNGVGKSSIVNALSYAWFGIALTNIKKDNLINKTNAKNMLVTLKFDVNGKGYTIERGRKPNVFKFIEDGVVADSVSAVKDDDESQGESRHTQEEIVRTIGFTHDMFKHIVALNTYVEPFLSMKAGDQRSIIEQLLGITLLSEKAEKLKKEISAVKDNIKSEEVLISAISAANKRIELNIVTLLEKSDTWDKSKNKRIDDLQASILEYMSIDIDSEISLHKLKKESLDLQAEYKSVLKECNSLDTEISSITRNITKLNKALSASTEHHCPTCNQIMDKDTHEHVHQEYSTQLAEESLALTVKSDKKLELSNIANSVKSIIPEYKDPFYKTVEDAYNHKTKLDTLGNTLERELATVNPYIDQIESLKLDGIQDINFDKINELTKLKEHQEFLLKLLTSKDSFIRKKIIDQNLSYLNHRLAYYLEEIGLPHTVKFMSDLEVEITMYGKDFDFDNLSRGERTRLILSLSWAFRDVYEWMNDKINLLFVDELLDNGLDTSGIEASLGIIKKMSRENKRNIFLISHREELIGRVPTVLKVIKESGFTTIEEAES